jgi:predicted ATPase
VAHRFFFHYTGYLAALADALLTVERLGEARAALDEAFARCDITEERWSLPELLRVRSELLVRDGAAKEAEVQLEQALALARRQEVLSWELRCATSLARLRHRQHRTSLARQTLAPVYRRFTEGFQTADLVSAAALLDALGAR